MSTVARAVIIGLFTLILTLMMTGIASAYVPVRYAGNETGAMTEENLTATGIPAITEQDALAALAEIQKDIEDMKYAKIGTVYMQDRLYEAKEAYTGRNITQILAEINKLSNESRREYADLLIEATKNLAQNKTKIGENYTKTVEIAANVRARKNQAFAMMDELTLLELKIASLNRKIADYTESDRIYDRARAAFNEERYDESAGLINQTYSKITEITVESSRTRAVLKASQRTIGKLIQKYWPELIIAFIILSIIGIYGYDKIRYYKLRRRTKEMLAEQKAIDRLLKKAQAEYFQEGKISKATYTMKMTQLKERKSAIRSEYPVLEKELQDMKKPFALRAAKRLTNIIKRFIKPKERGKTENGKKEG